MNASQVMVLFLIAVIGGAFGFFLGPLGILIAVPIGAIGGILMAKFDNHNG